jgi:putative spermidine/putrescine transport system substrate-binding protein
MAPVKRAVLSSLGLLLAGTAAGAQTLTINSFGGAYEEAHRECIIAPFEEATGATVQIVTAYSADAFAQLRAQRDAPQFDVIHFSGGQEIVAAQEGLLAPIDPADLSNAADLVASATPNLEGGEGPAYSIVTMGLVHNAEALTEAPDSWADLANPEWYPRLVLTDMSNTYGMQGFLMLNQVAGGSLEDIQPGLDLVAEMLEGGAVVVSTSPEILQEFAQNDAWIAPYSSDYAFVLRDAGLPVGFAQGAEGTPGVYITANLVAGRPNPELALQLIDRSISPEAQVCFAERMRYAPTNLRAELEGEVGEDTPFGEEALSGLIRFDPEVIEERRSEWVDAWNRTIAR